MRLSNNLVYFFLYYLAFSNVIQELWAPNAEDKIINTTNFKSQIQKFAPRFMGYAQQDAQEFLRYLLEGLHEDVNRVTVKPQQILTDIDDSLRSVGCLVVILFIFSRFTSLPVELNYRMTMTREEYGCIYIFFFQ